MKFKKINFPSTSRTYKQEAVELAFMYAPHIYPCAKCGHPVAHGYCCGTCGDTNPFQGEEYEV